MKESNDKKYLNKQDANILKTIYLALAVLVSMVLLNIFLRGLIESDEFGVFYGLGGLVFGTVLIDRIFKVLDRKVKVGEEVRKLKEEQEKNLELHRQKMFSEERELEFRKKVIQDSIGHRGYYDYYDDISNIDERILKKSLVQQTVNEKGKPIRYKNGMGVEGIAVGREYNQMDKDKDGRILISEIYPLTEAEVLEKILMVDNTFSKTEFKTFVRSVFMLIQKAWSNNDYLALRLLEADNLYYEHSIKIKDLINKGIVDKRENIGIKGVLLKDFRVEGDREILVVALTARMDRNFDDTVFKSRELLEQSLNKNSGDVPYIMTFMRKKGLRSKYDRDLASSNCPNCGAVVDFDENGICTYCKTSMVAGDIDWILIDIKNIELVEF